MDRGAWQAPVHVVKKSQTRLSDFHSLHWLAQMLHSWCSLWTLTGSTLEQLCLVVYVSQGTELANHELDNASIVGTYLFCWDLIRVFGFSPQLFQLSTGCFMVPQFIIYWVRILIAPPLHPLPYRFVKKIKELICVFRIVSSKHLISYSYYLDQNWEPGY